MCFNDMLKTIKSLYNFNILIFNQFSFILNIIKQLQTLSYLSFLENIFIQVNLVYFFQIINLVFLLIYNSFFSNKYFAKIQYF